MVRAENNMINDNSTSASSPAQSLTATCHCSTSSFTAHFPSSASSTTIALPGTINHSTAHKYCIGTLCSFTTTWPSSSLPTNIRNTCSSYTIDADGDIWFCSTCGAKMFWGKKSGVTRRAGNDGDIIEVAVFTGVLQGRLGEGKVVREEEKAQVKWEKHVNIEDTRDGGFAEWVESVSGKSLERLNEGEGGRKATMNETSSNSDISMSPYPPDSLPAHCACNGVRFAVTRPSAASSRLSSPLPDVLEKTDSSDYNADTWWLASPTQYLAGTCACESCRLCSGQEIVEWSFVPASNILVPNPPTIPDRDDIHAQWTHYQPGTSFGTLQTYTSSTGVTRYFCKNCGCGVFWTGDFRKELIDVAVGLLDAPEGARAESWLKWVRERVSYEEETRDAALVEEVGRGLRAWSQT